MKAERYPLSWPNGWPRKRGSGGRSPFESGRNTITRTDSIRRLDDELRRIGASNPILSTNWELRLDGAPRLDRGQPSDPGAAVYFKLKGQPRVLACDRYYTTEANIAAIAAHISAVRAIDRYGVGSLDQAFAGYTALPAQASPWWTVLEFEARPSSWSAVQARHTELAQRHHPDRGGSTDTMAKINAARDAARIDLQGGA